MKRILSAVVTTFLATTVNSAPIIFFGEDLNNSSSVPLASTPNADSAFGDFSSNLTGVSTEDFESQATGTTSSISLNFPGSAGSIGATLTGSNMAIRSVPAGSTTGAGRYPTSGTQFLEANAIDFTIDFTQAISAFGFWGVDIGDFGGTVSLDLINGGTQTIQVPNTQGSGGSTDGSVLFFGFFDLNDSFTSITFDITSSGDIFAFDDMIIADEGQIVVDPVNPVPAPATFALIAAGLLGMRQYSRKKN
ncbi:PEP motif-containing protein [Oleiphilus messinensis]|uniref:PEP motif-containing protein n=2 Tax=Oleiphilus messinensis TaxID=141451 RepID=A0A1Y0I917_9GAMM|nr:PEP motif-containing protein [Oleiphilus messinensis]